MVNYHKLSYVNYVTYVTILYMKTDRRVRKTTKAIKQEVIRQMQKKKYDDLTVTDICAALDISRRTFYLHYMGIQDVFNDIFMEVNDPLYRSMVEVKERYGKQTEDMKKDPAMVREIFQMVNETISANVEYLRRLATEPSYRTILSMHEELLKELIRTYMDNTDIESGVRKIYLDYYISGVIELYTQWYRNVINLSLDEIRDFACELLEADIRYLNRRKMISSQNSLRTEAAAPQTVLASAHKE